MNALVIKETSFSPSVCLDPKLNKFEIKGASRPENAVEFYTPILNWLNEFGKLSETNSKELTAFHFDFDYLNSISVKLIFDSFKIIESINSLSRPVTILWYYNKGDTDMKETGEEYQKLIKLSFSIVAKESNV